MKRRFNKRSFEYRIAREFARRLRKVCAIKENCFANDWAAFGDLRSYALRLFSSFDDATKGAALLYAKKTVKKRFSRAFPSRVKEM